LTAAWSGACSAICDLTLARWLSPWRWSSSHHCWRSPFPTLIGVAIDDYIDAGDLPGLTRISLLIAAIYLTLFVATAGQRYLLSWTGQRVLASMRGQLFRHLQALPVGYHDTHIIGVTVSRVINDVAVINDLLSQGLITLIGDILLLIGIMVVMISMSPQLALYTFSVLPLMLLATYLFAKRAKSAFRARAQVSPRWSVVWPRTSRGCV
jgi:ABC-type multidrug transport system fused ATPase/permease subunit